VGGRYQILSLIERGGQGAVYKGRDLRDNDEVAVKILNDTVAANPEWRERMFREARALATLSGTAAVRVLDQQWTMDGALCLVMELLRGKDLEATLIDMEKQGRRLSVHETLNMFGPVVETLESAHGHGILHRDLKPSNIFVLDAERGGGVRLLDFGFAKFTRMPSMTADGFVAGSPSYIAPESWLGKKDLDHRIDVYALGAVIFRALAGQAPFGKQDLGTLLRLVTTAERPSLAAARPDLPPYVDDWVRLALAIDRDERFQRVTALWNALRSVLGA
jgi:serine/threonine-protein kinase